MDRSILKPGVRFESVRFHGTIEIGAVQRDGRRRRIIRNGIDDQIVVGSPFEPGMGLQTVRVHIFVQFGAVGRYIGGIARFYNRNHGAAHFVTLRGTMEVSRLILSGSLLSEGY